VIEAAGFAVELTEAQLMQMYRQLLTARLVGTRLRAVLPDASPGPLVGGEAPGVAMATALESGDVLFGRLPDAAAFLTGGRSVRELVADALAPSPEPGGRRGLFVGSVTVSVPADGIPAYAVGAAAALRSREGAGVVVADVGPSDTGRGLWHEAMEFAAGERLPVVFVARSVRRPDAEHRPVADRGPGYAVPATVVDASDVLECYDAVRSAIELAREGGGPSLIEAVLVQGADGGITLSAECVQRYEEYLGVRGMLDEQRRRHLAEVIGAEADEAIAAADAAPDPGGGDPFAVRTATPLSPTASGAPSDQEVTVAEAIVAAVSRGMERDRRAIVLTNGDPDAELTARFGPTRVMAAGVGSALLIGAAAGAALAGARPVVLMLGDAGCCSDLAERLLVSAGSQHGSAGVPVSMVAIFPELPPESMGLRVVAPGSASDARGIVLSAMLDLNPVVVAVAGPGQPSGTVPPGDQEVALDRAHRVREGDAASIVTWGAGVAAARTAADVLATSGVSVDLIDLRSLGPIDWGMVDQSLAGTGRLAIVEPGGASRIGAAVAARAAEIGFWSLDAPVIRLAVVGDPEADVAAIAEAVRTLVAI
jgi:2-oxoisovalerate dehydrogenase E1 component